MIGSSLQFRRYDHERHGVVETLTAESVVYVRPVFDLARLSEERPSEVAKFRSENPKRARKLRNGCGESNGDACNTRRKARGQS
jgi:hypothetical protein